jgi:hypothetical protein
LRHREKDDVTALTILQHWSPTAISGRAISQTPERYDVPSEARAFGFHYDAATFRGATDSTAVEVYYGLPLSKAAYFTADGKTGLRIVCRVALAREGGGPVYRSENEMIFVEKGDLTRTPGFVPHIARIEVPPGVYRMDVRVENRLNGEVGSYRKALTVEPYPAGSLKLSDIELASRITDNPIEGKFTKQGLQVIPMPTRHYGKGQPVWLYYEIYNLRRDESWKASYTVEYAVRSGKTSGLVSQVLRSFLGRERSPEVSVRQERLGLGETEIQHIQMDLGNLSPGEFTVRVTVKDVLTGQEASKEASFTVEGQEGTQRR